MAVSYTHLDVYKRQAHDGVASRIPSGRDDRYGFMFFGGSIQGTAQLKEEPEIIQKAGNYAGKMCMKVGIEIFRKEWKI